LSEKSATAHEGEVQIVVLIKASPEIGQKHGETVCVAGIDAYGNWHRLYPVPFKDLRPDQRFNRWDIIQVRWRRPRDDDRPESKRIDPASLRVVSRATESERPGLVSRALVMSIETEMVQGRSLALIRPENPQFRIRRMTDVELAKSTRRRAEILEQGDMFSRSLIAPQPPPYVFLYRFDHGGRSREHICIDWETEETFFKWRRQYGEKQTLLQMEQRWGVDIPKKGVVFAMGTHRVKMFKSWLLSGIIQAKEPQQSYLLV